MKEIYSNTPATSRKRRKKRKKKSSPLAKFCVFLIVLSVIGVGFLAVWNSNLFVDETDSGGAGLDIQIGTNDKKVIHFLIVGVDTDDGRESNRLTDTIMVASYRTEDKQVSVLQIPRDTYIGEEYTATGKINALYASSGEYAGIEGLANYIYEHFGIPIDHYATITMKGFRAAVDSIGGIEVNVPYPIDLDGVTLSPGLQTLDGNQAEKFVRQRKGQGYQNGDLDRLRMQRLFMASLVKQMLGASKSELAGMVPKVAGEISTDMSTGRMVSLVTGAMGIDSENITFTMVPGESVDVITQAYGKQSVYSVHKELLVSLVNERFRANLDPITAEQLDIPEIQNTYDNFDNVGGTVDEILGTEH